MRFGINGLLLTLLIVAIWSCLAGRYWRSRDWDNYIAWRGGAWQPTTPSLGEQLGESYLMTLAEAAAIVIVVLILCGAFILTWKVIRWIASQFSAG